MSAADGVRQAQRVGLAGMAFSTVSAFIVAPDWSYAIGLVLLSVVLAWLVVEL